MTDRERLAHKIGNLFKTQDNFFLLLDMLKDSVHTDDDIEEAREQSYDNGYEAATADLQPIYSA